MVWSYSGANVVLHGYDAQTLAQTASVLVPSTGPLNVGSASNVLTSGPDGHLYVAAGLTVAVVDPASRTIINRIYLTEGAAISVAVSPDGSTLYVGTTVGSGPFELVVKNLATSFVVNVSRLRGSETGGNLVATSGGVWGTTGVGMSEWTWFAPSGDLARAVRIGQGAGAGFDSVPSYSGGVVWVGGSHTLTCANPQRADPGHRDPAYRPQRGGVLRQSRARRQPGLLLLPGRRLPAVRPGPHDAARRLFRQRQLITSRQRRAHRVAGAPYLPVGCRVTLRARGPVFAWPHDLPARAYGVFTAGTES